MEKSFLGIFLLCLNLFGILLLSLLAFSLSLKTKIKIKTTPSPEVASLKKKRS